VIGRVHSYGCNPGPHVHIEVQNTTNFSCWTDLGRPGSRTINDNTTIGRLGSNNTSARKECAASSPPPSPAASVLDRVSEQAVASGDFNNDGYDDLAIGAPGEDLSPASSTRDGGSVNIAYGHANGVFTDGASLNQDNTLTGTAESGDNLSGLLPIVDTP